MADINIFTNNSSVEMFLKQYKLPYDYEIIFVDASSVRVFQAAKESVQKGAELLNSPVSPRDEKCENPFKTLILTEPEGDGVVLHFQSMAQIESASRAYTKAAKNRFRAYTDDNIKDFKTADLEQLLAGLQNILRTGLI